LFRPDGRTLIVAMDHAQGGDKPLPGLVHPGETIRKVVQGGADAVISTYGTAVQFADDFAGCGLILTVRPEGAMIDVAIETALMVGAEGIKVMIFPWFDGAPQAVTNAARLGAECKKWQLVYVPEIMPGGGRSGPEWRTPEKIAGGARVGAEVGGDFVKTFYTGSPETFKIVTDNCPVPVVILGGPQMESEEDLLNTVKGSVEGGGKGIAFGRNIWMHAHPEKLVAAIAAVLHDGATVAQALKKLN